MNKAEVFGDSADVRVRVLNVLDDVCTRKQAAAVRLFLEDQSLNEIAHAMGVSKPRVHQLLYGDARDRGRSERPSQGGCGAFERIRRALEGDVVTNETKEDDDVEMTKDKIGAWFSRLRPSQAHLFGPLSALLVMDAMADARRSISVADLQLYLPKPVATASLGALRQLGYIATDGVTITIRKTPLDDMKEGL